MDLIAFAAAMVLLGIFIGLIVGWWAATHVHSVANAASRATTIPAGDVAALNATAAALGTKVQGLIDVVTKPAIAAAIASTEKPPAA